LITFSGAPGAAIPDNNPVGLGYGFTVNSTESEITSMSVTLNISGGYNGDIYAYLAHGAYQSQASSFSVLLNRTGASGGNPDGYSDSGFNNLTLASGAGDDIHLYRLNLGGPGVPGGPGWTADGRLNPTDVARNHTLDIFNGTNPNGDWTLFLADRSAGIIGTLDNWSVEITAIPEPRATTAAMFLVLLCGVQEARRFLRNRRTTLR
jgi:subtilisin-like proprotein convertase family protein